MTRKHDWNAAPGNRGSGQKRAKPPKWAASLLQHAERLELRNLVGGVAGVAQHGLRMLADGGRADRCDLGLAVDVEGARYREAGAVGERHQGADLVRLRVVAGLVYRAHRTEGDAGLLEDRAPFRQVALGEDLVEDRSQRLVVRESRRLRVEARVLRQMLQVDRLEE